MYDSFSEKIEKERAVERDGERVRGTGTERRGREGEKVMTIKTQIGSD